VLATGRTVGGSGTMPRPPALLTAEASSA
jgi:hypothetical protein